MKTYPKESYIFEFSKEELRDLENILKEVNTDKLTGEQEILLDEIDDCIDSILHP